MGANYVILPFIVYDIHMSPKLTKDGHVSRLI